MYNDLINIGKYTIHTYGVCIALGIIITLFVLRYRLKKYNKEYNRAIDIILFAIIPGFIGAKLNFILVNLTAIRNGTMNIDLVSRGYVIYGGVLAGMLSVLLYFKFNKLDIFDYADITIPSVALAQGFGRIGCFMAGCCYGIAYDGPLCVTFKHSDYAPSYYSLFPTQLVFALFDFLNFWLLCFAKKKVKKNGEVLVLYCITYSIGRFSLEFLRGDLQRGTVFGISTSQFISIIMILIGCILYALVDRDWKKKKENINV